MTSLRRRVTEDMQVRNLSSHTQATYVQQVLLFARHFNKSPEILGPEEIRSYQIYLTNERKLAPSSIIIAVAALRFLYKITLHKNWNFEEVIPSPKKPQKLPIVLTQEEVLKFLASERYEKLTGSSLWQCPICRQGRMLVTQILPRRPPRQVSIKDTS
jgi:integrase/recombinase XerD